MFSIKHLYTLLFCFVFILIATAQDRKKAIALKYVLHSIEMKHHITFNYIETDINEVTIVPPNSALSLEEKLDYLKKKNHPYI